MRGFFCQEQTVHFKVTHLSYSLISSFFLQEQLFDIFQDSEIGNFFLKRIFGRVFTGMSVCYVKIYRVVIFMSVDYS